MYLSPSLKMNNSWVLLFYLPTSPPRWRNSQGLWQFSVFGAKAVPSKKQPGQIVHGVENASQNIWDPVWMIMKSCLLFVSPQWDFTMLNGVMFVFFVVLMIYGIIALVVESYVSDCHFEIFKKYSRWGKCWLCQHKSCEKPTWSWG